MPTSNWNGLVCAERQDQKPGQKALHRRGRLPGHGGDDQRSRKKERRQVAERQRNRLSDHRPSSVASLTTTDGRVLKLWLTNPERRP